MVQLIQIGDYFGTFVFAVTGGLAAAEKRFDLGGFVLLAFVTGVGGGTMRDLIIQRESVFWAIEPIYIILCVAGGLATFLWGSHLKRVHRALVWGDAVGLAVFAVVGSAIAILHECRPLVSILMGVLTATGGGVIRDVIRNEVPLVLHREIYVSAALLGSALVVGLHEIGAPPWLAIGAGAASAFALRALAIRYDLHPPVYGQGAESREG